MTLEEMEMVIAKIRLLAICDMLVDRPLADTLAEIKKGMNRRGLKEESFETRTILENVEEMYANRVSWLSDLGLIEAGA